MAKSHSAKPSQTLTVAKSRYHSLTRLNLHEEALCGPAAYPERRAEQILTDIDRRWLSK